MRDFSWNMAVFVWQETTKIEDVKAFHAVCNQIETLSQPDNMITAIQQLKNLYDIERMQELL